MKAQHVASSTSDAYMADAYGPAAWQRVAAFLLKEGHTPQEAAAIMRSKHMRWADDSEGAGAGKGTTSAAFARYYAKAKEQMTGEPLRELVGQTFMEDWEALTGWKL